MIYPVSDLEDPWHLSPDVQGSHGVSMDVAYTGLLGGNVVDYINVVAYRVGEEGRVMM